MGKAGFNRIILLTLFCLVLTGCSGDKEADQTKVIERPRTEQTVEALKEYGKRPIDKARAVQQLGEERSKTIDESVGGQ